MQRPARAHLVFHGRAVQQQSLEAAAALQLPQPAAVHVEHLKVEGDAGRMAK